MAGQVFYICAPSASSASRSGCIVFPGVPEAPTRKKIRTALSFALGAYLVETGHTIYDNKWHMVSATLISAHSIGHLSTMPLMWLTERNRQFDIARPKLQRMVERLFSAYDWIDLGNLSWAYWHARAATVHIAPAHFGAAIEALQTAYTKKHSDKIRTTILPDPTWKELLAEMSGLIAATTIPNGAKKTLTDKIRSGTNSVPPRERLREIAKQIKIDIGAGEDAAWKRRNLAAHGVPIPEGKELEAIRDMKLLMGLFHRMLLSITGAADEYIDYASPGLPSRRLKEPVP